MIKKTLTILSKMPYLSIKGLSDKLDVSPGMVEALLEDMKRLGYIKEEQCDSSCSSCQLATFCSGESNGIIYWQITEKGKKAIESP